MQQEHSTAPPAPGEGGGLRVDFYVLEEASPAGRLKLACRLAEKAYLAAHRVLVWHTEAEELKAFDEMLWTFNDRSFVPHEWLAPGSDAPVLLSAGTPPVERVDVLINLSPDMPPLTHAARIAEVIDGEEARRRAGRARFKAYRELGLQPATHTLRGE